MPMRAFAVTSAGKVRPLNEDFVHVNVRRGLLAIADGMGGHDAGEIASRMAVETLREHLRRDNSSTRSRLLEAGQAANRTVLEHARATGSNMGTTLSATLLEQGRAAVLHAGDSRVYLLHEGALRQLTEDQTVTAEKITRGEITAEEGEHDPERHVLLQAVGVSGRVDFQLLDIPVGTSDKLLLCSDGLTGHVSDAEIEQALGAGATPPQVAEALLAMTMERGATDNVSIIVADQLDRPRRCLPRAVKYSAVLAAVGVLGACFLVHVIHQQRFLELDNGPGGDSRIYMYSGVRARVGPLRLSRRITELPVTAKELRAPFVDRLRAGIPVHSVREAAQLIDSMRKPETPQPPSGDQPPAVDKEAP